MSTDRATTPEELANRLAHFEAKRDAYASPREVEAMLDDGSPAQLVDVRVGGPELLGERIPESVHIPQTELPERADQLAEDEPVVLYCWDTWCSLATKAAVPLLKQGFDVRELYGGIAAWNELGLPTEDLGSGDEDAGESGSLPSCGR